MGIVVPLIVLAVWFVMVRLVLPPSRSIHLNVSRLPVRQRTRDGRRPPSSDVFTSSSSTSGSSTANPDPPPTRRTPTPC